MKETYINLMEKVLEAYSREDIIEYTQRVKAEGLSEHGYPRLVANLGILICHGRKKELIDLFSDMMDLCCREIPTAHDRAGFVAGNDFSVKEVVLCLLELEKSEVFPKSQTDKWRKALSDLNPYSIYSEVVPEPPVKTGNWAAFAGTSEQMRKFANLSDESHFIDNQIESQLFSFDEKGMYIDPGAPMVYDSVTRLQLAMAVYYGYDGHCKEELCENLLKSADITLHMQSVTGEIPCGGRSNQFLHNEAFYAALCEFYAVFMKKRGDLKKAGMFKRAARLSAESVAKWLLENPITHIKNRYGRDSKYGCEDYAYFDKYMVTTGSWFYLAYAFADESIEEISCPSQTENYVVSTTDVFSKTFLKYGDWFVEEDHLGDYHYDCLGVGRVHKRGAPSSLCLSTAITDTPNYVLDIKNPSKFSICGGIKCGDEFLYGYENTTCSLTKTEENHDFVSATFRCKSGDKEYDFIISVMNDGVEFVVKGDGELQILFPLFETDGREKTEITFDSKMAEVSYRGFTCSFSTPDEMHKTDKIYANRNGHYIGACVKGKDEIKLKIDIERKDD